MMKEMNEKSAEQWKEVLRMTWKVQQRCARFKLSIASWLVLIKLIKVKSELWLIQTCS